MLDGGALQAQFGDAPQRVAALVGLPALLDEFAVPLSAVLEGVPIEPTVFDSDENLIPYGLATRLMEVAAAKTGCPHFGLLLGSRFDHRCMGAAGQWMANAPTLEAALTGFIALQPTATRGATAYLHRYGDDVILGYGAYDHAALGHTQIYACVTAVAANLVPALTNGAVRPVEVLLSFRRPVHAKPYEMVLQAPVRFDQPQTGLVLPFAALGSRIAGANPVDFAALQQRAAAIMPPDQRIWSGLVARILRMSMLRGEVTASHVARRLGISQRTLARRLASEGNRFQTVLDEIRFFAARELLAVTELPVGDVALALGYATHPAFDDAFRRWSGTTPQSWRSEFRSR
jgi:AraC-like DNA-binding protein